MTTKLTRGAEVRAESYSESDNSVEVVWTTGAGVRRRDWNTGEYYSEILEVTPKSVRLDRLNAGAPFLDTHDDRQLASIIGSVIPGTARIEGGKGYARIKLSAATADADSVGKIRDGIIRNISVGYAIHKFRVEPAADGGDEKRIITDWEPLEISAVPIPADAGAQIRSRGGDEVPALGRQIRAVIDITPLDTAVAAALRIGCAAAWIDGETSVERNFDDAFRALYGPSRDFETASMAGAAAAAFTIARLSLDDEQVARIQANSIKRVAAANDDDDIESYRAPYRPR